MTAICDVAVVGSGPSGSLAASKLLERGLDVVMIDVGRDDDHYRSLIPDEPFSVIRRSDPQQHRYFLGDRMEGVPSGDVKVGAQLTPPRQFVMAGVDEVLPVSGDDFEPMQSLALGGLGAAWGAASFTYNADELAQIGVGDRDFGRYYREVAELIGVSGDPDDDASRDCFEGVDNHQPPLDLDSVTQSLWEHYLARRESFRRRGLTLGRTPLAVLSRDLGDRRANPYFDMDFWSDSRKSVFRPRYLVEELQRQSRFKLERGQLVLRFDDRGEAGVEIRCRAIDGTEIRTIRARRLLLCAGAINSARIALNSLGRVDEPVPMLCNP
jgi:choline dehydrogenase-like flavoprotein